MRRLTIPAVLLAIGCASTTPAPAPARPASSSPSSANPGPPVEADEYTRYELLAPETSQFHILYEVTAVAPGATAYFNPIRKGSVASGERVTDRMTGEDLRFEVVSPEEARRSGLADAEEGTDYIRVHLPRPVPSGGGQVRLLIEKTYKDPKSYFADPSGAGGEIVFTRSLGIPRNSVVLPAGYELVSCNVPSQVLTDASGRIFISFMNAGPAEAPLTIRARKLPS
ncbi:MAG TPA: hypothetical protein VIA45_00955 [Thermoanaerobaculia bacterium]|jgi:hypothetical protein